MSRGRFPASIGAIVAEWIEANCRHGPGDVYGKRVRLTAEEFAFLEQVYSIDRRTGRRLIDEAMYSRRKGTRKSELGAWIVAAESRGPVRARFGEDGKPEVGPPVDPWVICCATTENQGDLVYGAFREFVAASEELAQLYDTGLEITYLTDRPGKIALEQSRNFAALDGARPTFEVADEAHLWVGSLRETYSTLRRNLRKRRASQPWILGITTAYAVGARSIAETHHERAVAIEEGLAPPGRFLFDHRQASEHHDLDDPDQLAAAIREAGGDADWSDEEAIAAEYHNPEVPLDEFQRYWLNQPAAPTRGKFIDALTWAGLARKRPAPPRGAEIVLAFDGSYSRDSTALIGCTADAHLFVVGHWENPNPKDRSWRVPRAEVRAKVAWAMSHWTVVELAPDPFTWLDEIEEWEQTYADVVVRFETNQPSRFGPACTRFHEGAYNATFTHDGNAALARHITNSVPKPTNQGDVITKDAKDSPRKIDLAVGAIIAFERATWHWQQTPKEAPTVEFV